MFRRNARGQIDLAQLDMSRCELETFGTLEKFIRDNNIDISRTLAGRSRRVIRRSDLCTIIREWHANQIGGQIFGSPSPSPRESARVVQPQNSRIRRPNNQPNNHSSQRPLFDQFIDLSSNEQSTSNDLHHLQYNDSPMFQPSRRRSDSISQSIDRPIDLAIQESNVDESPSQPAAPHMPVPQCSVCLEYYDVTDHKPMILPCGHGVCLQCADSLVPHRSNNRLFQSFNQSNNDYDVACPECRGQCPRNSVVINRVLFSGL